MVENRLLKNRKKSALKLKGLDNGPVSGGTRVGGVRKRDETKEQFAARMGRGQTDNSDIDAIFRGVQNTRGMVRRDMRGNVMMGDQPTGLDKFFMDNPHLRGAADRQAAYDSQAREHAYRQAGQNSVMRAQAQKDAESNPNLVTDANGYRTIFDNKGGVIGTTAPVKNTFSGYQGENAAGAQGAFNRGEATKAESDVFRRNLQQTGFDSAAGRIKKPSKPSGMDQIFGGGAKQTSPSGGATRDLVGSPGSQGAPGGEFSQGFDLPAWVMDQERKQMDQEIMAGLPSDALRNGRSQLTGYQDPANYGGFVPNQQQQVAINKLQQLGNTQIRAMDLFPGDDYQYIEQLFPGFKFSNYRTTNLGLEALRELMNRYSSQSAVVAQQQRGR